MDKYTISNHAKQRYAERIMGRDDTTEINRYVNLNEEKIKTDINKMITYGELIYTGIQHKNDKKLAAPVDVYVKDCWVVIADNKIKNVITLYKIDLGVDDEFNKLYINKMLEKLNTAKKAADEIRHQIEEENLGYTEIIEESEISIKQYRSMINNLEKLIDGYNIVLSNNTARVAEADMAAAEVLNTLIGKKTF
jgi:hypothetical protein